MVSPNDVLLDFMKEMNSWEKQCAARMEQCIAGTLDFDEATKVGTAEYMEIFSRYCSLSRAVPRDFYYTEPPDYDPKGEVILNVKQISPNTAEMFTQQNYSHRKRHVFMLALEKDGWRLVGRRVLLDNGEFLEAGL